MQIKIPVSLFFFLIIFSPAVWASTLTDSVLKDGIGVRAMGMGGAFTALADDSSAVFYNPAGLVLNCGVRIEKGYQDINYNLARTNEYAIFNYGLFGFAAWNKTDLSGEAASVVSFSYARPATASMSWGFSYKSITGDLGAGKNSGASLDVGLLGSFTPEFYWGILFQDIIDNAGLGGAVRGGLAHRFFSSLTLLGDVEYRNIKSAQGPEVYTHLGVELQVMEGLALRGGYYRDRWTGGGSLIFHPVSFDYALQASSGPGGQAIQMLGVKVEI